MTDSKDFNRALLRGATTRTVSVVMRNGSRVRRQFVTASAFPSEIAEITAANPSDDIFIGLGLLADKPNAGRGTSQDVVTTVGLYIDLDMPRSDDSKYDSRSEATISLVEILDAFAGIGLSPTAVTRTGNGSHIYFLLNEPFEIVTADDRHRVAGIFKGVSQYVRDKLAVRGWKTDITADLARLDRAVGSYNVKDATNPKLVTVDFLDDERRYTLDELASFAPAPVLRSRDVETQTDPAEGTEQKNLGNFDAVVMGCPFMAHCVANPAALSEPEWRAMIGTLAYCKNGRTLAHKYSAGHLGYDPAQTDTLFDRMSEEAGPPTYAHIRTILSSFEPDEAFGLYGTVVAPISFAYYEPELVRLMGGYVYDLTTDRFIDLRTMAAKTEKAFRAEHVHRQGLKNPPEAFYRAKVALRAQKRDYLPGSARVLGGPNDLVLNTYRPPALLPVEGPHDLILRHFEVLIPDKAVRENVLDRLAFAVQHPDRKMESAIVLYGPPGGGKSTIVRWIGELIGPWNMRSLPTSTIESKYGAAKGNIQLAVFDEIRGVTKDGVNSLKSLETEPTVWVEEKHQSLHEIRTPNMIVMMSNYANALPLDQDDRRHLVINTPAVIPSEDYFNALYAKAPDQLPGFAHFLHERDLAVFNPHETPMATRGKEEMVKAAMPNMQRAIFDAKEARIGVFEKDFGTAEDVAKALIEDGWPTFLPPSTKLLGTVLSELGIEQMPRRTLSNGSKPRLRVWRNTDKWREASRSEIEAHLLAKGLSSVTTAMGAEREMELV